MGQQTAIQAREILGEFLHTAEQFEHSPDYYELERLVSPDVCRALSDLVLNEGKEEKGGSTVLRVGDGLRHYVIGRTSPIYGDDHLYRSHIVSVRRESRVLHREQSGFIVYTTWPLRGVTSGVGDERQHHGTGVLAPDVPSKPALYGRTAEEHEVYRDEVLASFFRVATDLTRRLASTS